VIIRCKIFTEDGIAALFSLRYSFKQNKKRLTICATADAAPEAFADDEPILELIDGLPHVEKAFIRFAHACKCIEESVLDVINESWCGFWPWRVCEMLVHMNMLHDVSSV